VSGSARKRRLVFVTQQIDPAHPALAATVAQVRALAERLDEVVVLADGVVPAVLPPNCRFHTFASAGRLGRGARFEAALIRELVPRPLAVVAHMCPIYAVLAAPLARPLRVPIALWFTHWKASRLLALAERCSSVVLTVNETTFPLATRKLRPIGHGIDVDELTCAEPTSHGGFRALVLGRTSPAKGVIHILRAAELARRSRSDIEVDVYGPSLSSEEQQHRRELEAAAADADGALRIHDAVPRSEVPGLLAASDCLVNNMRAGATDKVVYEAAASCVPVLASNPGFADILEGLALDFPREDEEALAARLLHLAELAPAERRQMGRTLRERVVAGHSVDAWADKLLAAVAQ
jgi:glycosyltransferase involved in cell wall biosynthesis